MNGIADAVYGVVIFVVIVAFAVGALAMWGIPKLWEFVKPLLHALTA